jgi:hypothetical protein
VEVKIEQQILSIPLEGYDVFYTLGALCHSFEAFLQHPSAMQHTMPHCVLMESLESLTLAYQVKKAWLSSDILDQVKRRYEDNGPIVLLSGIYNHNINYILMDNTCGYMNRGLLAESDRYGSLLYAFERKEAIRPTFISGVISRSNTHILEKNHSLSFFNTQFKKQLALHRKAYFYQKAKQMKGGHCAWTNVKQILPTLLTLCFLKHYSNFTIQEAAQKTRAFYKEWSQWDRTESLKNFIKKHPMSSIEFFLFYRVFESHHDVHKPAEVERGRLMLAAMSEGQKRRLPQTEAVQLFIHACEAPLPPPIIVRHPPTSYSPLLMEERPKSRCCVVL